MILQKLKQLFKSFRTNEAGAFAVITAVMAPTLVIVTLVAADTSYMYRNKGILQNALDTSALAAAKYLGKVDSETELQDYAEEFFNANIGDKLEKNRLTFELKIITPTNASKRVWVKATYDHPAYLEHFGFNDIVFDVISEVAAANRTIEVAIVIDNSGSMDSRTGGTRTTRMENAKEAANALAAQLFELAKISNRPDPVRISIVPFGASVNIGASNRGASWMDRYGWSSIHHENIAWDSYDKRGDKWPSLSSQFVGYKGKINGSNSLSNSSSDWLTRWSLFDALNTPWGGCVEMRPWPYNVTDDAPNENTPDTLYVPSFAPDEPDRETYSEDAHFTNDYLDDYRRSYAVTNFTTKDSSNRHYLNDYINGGYNYNNFTRQHWRQNWAMKYNSASASEKNRLGKSYSGDLGKYGPNFSCTTKALTPLTSSLANVTSAIDDMAAGGYTNVQAGIQWGWRSLSAGEPFTEGKPYSTLENDKYIIVLTDGNNTYAGQSTYNLSNYAAWGYEKDERLYDGVPSSSDDVTAMNLHTEQTCTNIKAIQDADNEAAYKIFTIAYDVTNGSSVKNLLYSCASTNRSGGKYYYDVSGSALTAALQAIGNEISDLRIAK